MPRAASFVHQSLHLQQRPIDPLTALINTCNFRTQHGNSTIEIQPPAANDVITFIGLPYELLNSITQLIPNLSDLYSLRLTGNIRLSKAALDAVQKRVRSVSQASISNTQENPSIDSARSAAARLTRARSKKSNSYLPYEACRLKSSGLRRQGPLEHR